MSETRFTVESVFTPAEINPVTLLVGVRGKHEARRKVVLTETFLRTDLFKRAMAEAVEKAKVQVEEDLDLLELGEELLAREKQV